MEASTSSSPKTQIKRMMPSTFGHRRLRRTAIPTTTTTQSPTQTARPATHPQVQNSKYRATHLRRHNVLPRAELTCSDDAVAAVIRWVDDACVAGTQEGLYPEDYMARWCDEVGRAVREEGGAEKAVEKFEEWLAVL